jgi:hypothetical protein
MVLGIIRPKAVRDFRYFPSPNQGMFYLHALKEFHRLVININSHIIPMATVCMPPPNRL